MDKILGPTGCLLVGAVFICLLISLNAIAAEMQPNLPDLQKELKEAQFSPFNHINREWEIRLLQSSVLRSDLTPRDEKIALNESDSSEQVSDLTAMNAAKERDINYNGEQYGDPETQGLVNSLDVAVTGRETMQKNFPDEKWDDSNIDTIVDEALNTSRINEGKNGRLAWAGAKSQMLGNYLDIDVSGISVRAVNTVPGGSAVATSNIIIKPVQIIICPSEVAEKLR